MVRRQKVKHEVKFEVTDSLTPIVFIIQTKLYKNLNDKENYTTSAVLVAKLYVLFRVPGIITVWNCTEDANATMPKT